MAVGPPGCAVPGGAGGHLDQVAADGGAAGRVATSRRRPPLAADSDTPENLAEVVGQADR
jgi:hypothetical protein